jgi:hypothetical protein
MKPTFSMKTNFRSFLVEITFVISVDCIGQFRKWKKIISFIKIQNKILWPSKGRRFDFWSKDYALHNVYYMLETWRKLGLFCKNYGKRSHTDWKYASFELFSFQRFQRFQSLLSAFRNLSSKLLFLWGINWCKIWKTNVKWIRVKFTFLY